MRRREGRGPIREGGQAAAEFAAFLGLVALIVAGLASSGIGAAVAGSVKSALCSVSYDAIQAELGYSRGRKISSAVQRTDADHVQVTVGDADLVQSTLAVALGTDEAGVSLASEKSLADGKTRQVDIDISTAEGRRAYQSFVKTGRLPGNATTSKVIDYSGSTKLGGKLAGMEAKLIASDVTGQIVETTNPDGSTAVTQFGRDNEVGFSHQFTIGADGKPGRSVYTLRLQDVPASLAGALAKQRARRQRGSRRLAVPVRRRHRPGPQARRARRRQPRRRRHRRPTLR